MRRRAAGILLHPTSLPGGFGIGDLGPATDRFLDWAAAAGQRVWQVLPLAPTDGHGSPYSALSVFAGNPLLLSPERLAEDGLLPDDLPEPPEPASPGRVEFEAVRAWKRTLLRRSWERFRRPEHAPLREELGAFARAAAHADWLHDWALFAAIREEQRDRSWLEWEPGIRRREPAAVDEARRRLADEVAFHTYLQFLFHRQWARVRAEAERRGVQILGDVPIYPALDSADVWARRDLFAVDDDGRPAMVAGVPPDYFAADGQLWGNPLYRWDRMEEDGYSWWIHRLRGELGRSHLVRLDHFRGFAAYWEVPATERTAAGGRWAPGPGAKLFSALRRGLGELPVVAEDLGYITQDVADLRDAFGLPGMKVLQFAFGEPDSPHLPHRHTPRTVVYTGTHDNDTTRGWFATADAETRRRVLEYAGGNGEAPERDLIRIAYASVAETTIVPMQDVLGLGGEGRMNVPGRTGDNWSWRAERDGFSAENAARLRSLAVLSGRAERE